jgi:hypothetical protein
MPSGQPETAATRECGDRSALFRLGQSLERDLENGLGFIGRRDDLVVTQKKAAVSRRKPGLEGRGIDGCWLLPVHVELHELMRRKRSRPFPSFRTEA